MEGYWLVKSYLISMVAYFILISTSIFNWWWIVMPLLGSACLQHGSGTWANQNGAESPWAALSRLSRLRLPKVVGSSFYLHLCLSYALLSTKLCGPLLWKKFTILLSFAWIGIYNEIVWLCLSPHTYYKDAHEMAVGSRVWKYAFKLAVGSSTECFIRFSTGLKLSSTSDSELQAT
jgi:hypothetical protein